MGIPHLAGYLQPFSDRINLGISQLSNFVIDGPGLAYHIYYRLCTNRSELLNPLDVIPSYRDIGRHVITFLDELEAHNLKMYNTLQVSVWW